MTKKRSMYALILFLLLSTFIFGNDANISGNAIYNDEIPLPDNAKFEVFLEDVSLMDAPSVIIGQSSIDPVGQTPIEFTINFDDDKIQLGQRYAVRAKITSNAKLLYITDTLNSVFSGKDDQNLQLIMKKIGKIPKSRVMHGMYKYMADAALFKECVTGKYYPVAFEEDSLALEKAYLKEVNGSNYFLQVELKGKIEKRPKMEGSGEESVLVVEDFVKILGVKDCTTQHANVPVTNNYWKLLFLYGEKVKVEANEKEAHILIKDGLNGTGDLKVVTGCNTIMGNYKIDENTIIFRADTLENRSENCKSKKLEKDFVVALDNAVYWQIEGEKLKLFDEMDNLLATFQAIFF